MVGESRPRTVRPPSVAAVEPTPIFAAMAGTAPSVPSTGEAVVRTAGEHSTGRPVTDLVRELRAERTAGESASSAVGRGRRDHVGRVPGVLSFRLPV
jgi:hypothetical protein